MNFNFNPIRRYDRRFPRPLTPEEEQAHRLGLQSWFRSFQPGFSEDPRVIEQFAEGFPGRTPLDFRYGAEDVRGPLAKYLPNSDFWPDEQMPLYAFTVDVEGNIMPRKYENRWWGGPPASPFV